MLLKLAVVWTLVQPLKATFSPNVMGKTLKIHPLTIIFILLCAGNLMGIVGVIIGILYTLYLRYWFHTYLCYLNEDTIATMEMMLGVHYH